MKLKQLSIRFPLDIFKKINELAKKQDRSFNGQVIQILKTWVHHTIIKQETK